jgi:hypothetical protein
MTCCQEHGLVKFPNAKLCSRIVECRPDRGQCRSPLEPNTMVTYKVNAYYSRDCDRNLRWNDPALGIPLPITPDQAVLSEKDRMAPLLSELGHVFD